MLSKGSGSGKKSFADWAMVAMFIGFCGTYALLILAFALLNWRLYHQFMADVFKRPEENGVQP